MYNTSLVPPTTELATEHQYDSSPPDYSEYLLSDGFTGGMFTLNLLLAAVGVPLNIGVILYHWPKFRTNVNLIPFIFVTLGSSDLVTCLSAGLHSLLFLILLVVRDSSSILYLALLAYLVSIVSFRASAMVSCTFSLIRTINIVSPFTNINKKAVVAAVILYTTIWLAEITVCLVMVVQTEHHTGAKNKSAVMVDGVMRELFYVPNRPITFGYLLDAKVSDALKCGLSVVHTGLSVSFLALVAFLTMIVQVVILVTPGPHTNKRDKDKKKMATTIILITLLFLICSFFPLLQPLSDCTSFRMQDDLQRMLKYCCGYLPFFFNAALNPLIFFCRASDVRTFILTRKRAPVSPPYSPTNKRFTFKKTLTADTIVTVGNSVTTTPKTPIDRFATTSFPLAPLAIVDA